MNSDNEDKVFCHLSATDKDLRAVVMAKSVCWGIEDIYNYGADDLIWVIERKMDILERRLVLH